MNFIIREADAADYTGVCRLVEEVHQLHVKKRPDVYRNVEAPLEKAEFEAFLHTEDAKIFVVEENENGELLAYGQVEIMPTKNPIYIPKKYAYIHSFCVKSGCKRRESESSCFRRLSITQRNSGPIPYSCTCGNSIGTPSAFTKRWGWQRGTGVWNFIYSLAKGGSLAQAPGCLPDGKE